MRAVASGPAMSRRTGAPVELAGLETARWPPSARRARGFRAPGCSSGTRWWDSRCTPAAAQARRPRATGLAALLHPRGERVEQALAGSLTLLGVELHGEDPPGRDGGAERSAVVGFSHDHVHPVPTPRNGRGRNARSSSSPPAAAVRSSGARRGSARYSSRCGEPAADGRLRPGPRCAPPDREAAPSPGCCRAPGPLRRAAACPDTDPGTAYPRRWHPAPPHRAPWRASWPPRSAKLPTPGSTTASARRTAWGSEVTSASRPERSSALATLRTLPKP